ncbi:D-alanyl-D-alanine carboxypeptidase [Desulfovibrio sulfodismutans]|uniref:D-alanyl-D-alanine carboxypeptidase n=1 Tax=Desulfolutivibrio sulfodismutans TaxID=63561 RepID=A0A7K3NL16_9BACT|nr:serine hydrolase [Desulfolutivibrio sulfodismutans]NDY56807.1 D-alanyl-D-alanine carboxypeptidase [Desulfolutivibrio sulfodismutans]QLA10946.1 D-alanyl-D-alanine carboxypeptidase [Desulfolutivibrio sulfodismutans DSM 3696]
MRRIFQILFFIAILVHGSASQAMAKSKAKAAPGELDVRAAMVMDFGTGAVLHEQDADRRIPPASITKIMTMYLVFEDIEAGRLRPSDQVKISARAAATGGSSMRLRAGEKVTVRELLDGMAVASGNDACIAVAEHLGGVESFVGRMNRKARELGMSSTTFENPNGLPSPGQFTTARDMMKLAASYLKRFPQSLEHHSKTAIRHGNSTRYNSNKLLQNCDGVDGIKTGWVAASGYNIVATSKRGDTRIIAVVLGGRSWQVRNRETQKILEASFSAPGQKTYLAEKSERRRRGRASSARITLADPQIGTVFSPSPPASAPNTALVAAIDESQATIVPVSGPQLRAKAAPPLPRPAAVETASRQTPAPSAVYVPKPFQPTSAPVLSQSASRRPALPPVAPAVTTAVAESSVPGHGELTLQESSFQTADEAKTRARKLERIGVPARVVTADLGDKGVWYRVMIGSFSSMQEARRYKQQLTTRHDLAHLIIREG